MEDMGNYGYTLFRTIPCFHKEFPHAVSYNRFVELMPRVFLSIQLVHGLKAKMKNKLKCF